MNRILFGLSLTAVLAGCGGGSESAGPQQSSQTSIYQPQAVVTVSSSSSSSVSSVASSSSSSSSVSSVVSSSSSSSSSSVAQVKPYFTEVANALKIYNPYYSTITTQVIPIDINGDGLDDLVVHQFQKQVPAITMTTGCNNVLSVYIMQPDRTFVDQTTKYLDTNNLGACSRKYRIVDINNDGKLDIIFAMNNEDGRIATSSQDMNAQMAAVVSTGATYKVVKFGGYNFYHSVGVGYDSNDRLFVIGNGYAIANDKLFYFQTGTANYSAIQIVNPEPTNPFVVMYSPTSFELFSTDKNRKYTDAIIQASNTYPNYTTAEGLQKNASGQWVSTGNVVLAPAVSVTANVTNNSGQTTTTDLAISTVKNLNITYAGMSETCQLKLTPNSSPVVVFALGGTVVPNTITNGMTVAKSTLTTIISVFRAVTIKNGVTTEVPLNIDNEQIYGNGNWFDCKDVNGDGYEDIVRYPFSFDGLPVIYINNQKGGFTYYGKTNLPSVTSLGWEKIGNSNPSGSSLVHDFDHDGYPDIIMFPPNGSMGNAFVNYRFFRGQRAL